MSADRWLIEGALIVTVNAQLDVFEGDILIEGGRIAALTRASERDAAPPVEVAPERRVDARGLTCIPGFVQTHIHLCQSLFRNLADDLVLKDWLEQRIWPFEGALSERSMAASVDYGLAELALGGTTTILDMGTVHHGDVIAERALASGLRVFTGKAMMDEGDTIPASLRETASQSIKASLALAERWHGAGDGRLQYAFCPRFAMSCSERLMREVGEIVADGGYIMHTHANETTWEVEESRRRWNTTNIGHLHDVGLTGPRAVLAHGVHFVDDERRILADTDTCVTHCPSSNLKLASGIADIPALQAAGIRVGLGADGAPCNNNLSAFVEMRLAALLQKPIYGPTAMPAWKVLKLATIDGARVLGIDDRVGSIEQGKDADLVLMDLNAPHHGVGGPEAEALGGQIYGRIVYAAQASDVRHVFAGGQRLVEDGRSARHDLDQLRAHGREALAEVATRLG